MANFDLRLEGVTVAKIEIDTAVLGKWLGGVAAQVAPESLSAKSAPLSVAQAGELLGHAERPMRQFLSRLVEEGGALTWGETKLAFDVKSWSDFADGPLKKLDKALHRLTGDKSSVLVWRIEPEWIGLEKGEDEPCRLHVDGPALAALKSALAAA